MPGTSADIENVSRETIEALEQFSEIALRWNASINLISKRDALNIWHRHIADSAQLFQHAPIAANHWVDLGSGGGFPGLVCAILARESRPGLSFTLIESDSRKCAFLGEASRHLGLDVNIVTSRIETAETEAADVISARALAPLPRLLELSQRFCHTGTVCLFPKGRNAQSELTLAHQTWHIIHQSLPSRTDPQGVILKISEVSRKS